MGVTDQKDSKIKGLNKGRSRVVMYHNLVQPGFAAEKREKRAGRGREGAGSSGVCQRSQVKIATHFRLDAVLFALLKETLPLASRT